MCSTFQGAALLFNKKLNTMSKNFTQRFQPSQKATVCFKNNCVTVYDEVAEVVNAIAIITTLVIAVSLIAKALK